MEINFEELLALCKSGRVNLRSDSALWKKVIFLLLWPVIQLMEQHLFRRQWKWGASIIVCSQKEACLPYENLKIFISHDPHETLIGLAKSSFPHSGCQYKCFWA